MVGCGEICDQGLIFEVVDVKRVLVVEREVEHGEPHVVLHHHLDWLNQRFHHLQGQIVAGSGPLLGVVLKILVPRFEGDSDILLLLYIVLGMELFFVLDLEDDR